MSRRYRWYHRCANEEPLGRAVAAGVIKFLWWLMLLAGLFFLTLIRL